MKKISVLILFVSIQIKSFSQLNITINPSQNDLMTGLIESGLTYSVLSINCYGTGYGTFTQGNSTNIGINEGVILTTGQALDAIGPNNSTTNGWAIGHICNYPDLYNIYNDSTFRDCCCIEFNFTPQFSALEVNFVFASEEYPEYVGLIDDAFGVFLTGLSCDSLNYVNYNIATLPDNSPISVNTVNSSNNSPYYVENTQNTIQYDGFTVPISTLTCVIPNETYTIKIIIFDYLDELSDSGVFIKLKNYDNNSVDESILATNEINIFPNPTNELINVLSKNVIDEIFIYAINGQQVFNQTVNSNISKINVSALPKGIYIAKITNQNSYVYRKIIIE